MMLPTYVENIIQRLISNGFEAYIVGGSVRDILLGVNPSDYDITSSATPDEIIKLFPKTIPTGIKHGTITVVEEEKLCEITTFRLDGEYLDHRHPQSVKFSKNIIEDLSRRDFTINAMAMNINGDVIDPFGGEDDLNKRIIKCVGNPQKRFEEDALRMLRAFRFASKLNFAIEENTKKAICLNYCLVKDISDERIRDEIEKILVSNNPQVISDVISIGLLDKYLRRVNISDAMKEISITENDTTTRWSLFSNTLLANNSIDGLKPFLQLLKLDNKTIEIAQNVSNAIKSLLVDENNIYIHVKQGLSEYGIDALSIATKYLDKTKGSHYFEVLQKVLNSNEPYKISMVDIDGDEIIKLGYKGKDIGIILNRLLNHVIRNPEDNIRNKLIELIKEDDFKC